MRPTYANVMATLAVVLALAAGGGQTLADAASSAATGVKRALKIGKQAKKTAKKARGLARAADTKAMAADAKAQQALTQKAPDADRLDGLDAADFVRPQDLAPFARTSVRTWLLPTGSDEELALPGIATIYVDCADNGYETEFRTTNDSGETQKVLLVSDDQDGSGNPPSVSGHLLAPGSVANRILGAGGGEHVGSTVTATLMPADGSGPSARVEVAVLTRSPAENCVANVRAEL